MKNLKYLLIMIIAVLGLNSCSYIWNQFTDAMYDLAHEGEEREKIHKDSEFAIINPNYTKNIKELLEDVKKREITKKEISFENEMYPESGHSLEVLIPVGTKIKGYHLIDEKTGYGLPIRLMTMYNDTPTVMDCHHVANKREGKWITKVSVVYGSPMSAEYIAKKIGEKNGFEICK